MRIAIDVLVDRKFQHLYHRLHHATFDAKISIEHFELSSAFPADKNEINLEGFTM